MFEEDEKHVDGPVLAPVYALQINAPRMEPFQFENSLMKMWNSFPTVRDESRLSVVTLPPSQISTGKYTYTRSLLYCPVEFLCLGNLENSNNSPGGGYVF